MKGKKMTPKMQRAKSRRYAKIFSMVREQYLEELKTLTDNAEIAAQKYRIKQIESDCCDEIAVYFNADSETAFPVILKEEKNKPSKPSW